MAEPEPEPPSPTEPWLVAAWPGMGSVALAAANYLLEKLGGQAVKTITDREHFDINAVAVEGGVVRSPAEPKSTFYTVDAGRAGRELVIFVGEAQPTHKGYDFCRTIIDDALARGVRRIVTFAAMATPVHPAAAARVFGVASEKALLPVLARQQIAVLAEGQITGLNGVLVAAAAERGLEAICLLGELPFFAVGIPNPKAALAVLRAFTAIAGVKIDLGPLEQQARILERALIEMVERATKAQAEAAEPGTPDLGTGADTPGAPEPAEREPGAPPPATLARIEALFQRARADKSQALALKAELDRLGLFKQYEDRFLDLFKREEHS